MAVTNYYSMDGMIFAESTNGVMRNYGTDALGSVVETIVNGAVENTYQYKPYGGLLAKTGTAPDPSFLWNGGSGYRAAPLQYAESYVVRRHFNSTQCLWGSVDPLWPFQPAYGYVRGNPATRNDPSGLGASGGQTPACCCQPAALSVVGIRYYFGTDTTQQGGSCAGRIKMPNWFGAGFQVFVNTFNNVPTKSQRNSPCSFSWSEWWNTDGETAPYTHKLPAGYRACWLDDYMSCQSGACPGASSCLLWDVPGASMDFIKKERNESANPSILYWDLGCKRNQNICMRLTHGSNCAPQQQLYILFTSSVYKDSITGKPVFKVNLNPSVGAGCNPQPFREWDCS